MSIVENTSLLIVPGSIVPGHQATDGTRKPPSHVEALLPINEDLVFLWLPKGEFTQYPFFVRFCFSLKKYALFHPHFYKSIYALSRLLYIDKHFVQKFCV